MQHPSPIIALLLPPSPHHHNGNLSACEWKMSRLRHAATISLIVRTATRFSAPTIYFCCIFCYAPVF